MTLDDRARELAERWLHGDDAHRQWLRDMIIPELGAALEVVRRETLEEAALLVDNWRPQSRTIGQIYEDAEQAVAIRALIDRPTDLGRAALAKEKKPT